MLLGVELEYLIDGVCNQERFLQLLRNFVAFDGGAEGFDKRVAKPHQYFAVTKAVGSTVAAVESNGKAGVVWHTQGSGKSMEMELYAHLVAAQPKLKNPTLVVVTDRTELDSQLFETFNRSRLLGETPVKVTTREQLREELTNRTTGGIYFTTLQKFGLTKGERDAGADHPLLSDRRNIIVIVDEAHRSHYDDLDGYARHIRDAMPNAAFIAFTGTPISFSGPEHAGGLRQSHRHLRPHTRRRGRSDCPGLLRAAPHPGATRGRGYGRAARRGGRRGHNGSRRRGTGADRKVGRSDQRCLRRARSRRDACRGHSRALGTALRGDAAVHLLAWQGVHRRCDPRDLRADSTTRSSSCVPTGMTMPSTRA